MRKHNKHMATRWGRKFGDRSNFAPELSHQLATGKGFQFSANTLLRGLLKKAI